MRIDDENRDYIFNAHGVVRYVFCLGKPAIVGDEEIAQIKMWLIDLDRKTREVEFLQSGDSVQIDPAF